ncbi:MAG TPA: hypothetical protein VFT59_04775 [Candidatus Saccharimonadales bacterium]|nr:hypothetical protein [Candidatus Saccharimonadales bacterium]
MKDETTGNLSDIDYITFADADAAVALHDDSSQLMVYGSIDEGDHDDAKAGRRTQSLYVMSALISKADFDKYLTEGTYYNYPFGELGNPGIWTDESDEIQFTLGQQREDNGITAHYFVRRYRPHGQGRTIFPIAQSFVFYHELTEYNRKYKRLYVDELDDAIVIREQHNPANIDQKRVIVSKHHLREYLAARNMGLAIWTSVRRYATIDGDFKLPEDINAGPRHIDVTKADWFGTNDKLYTGELVFKTLILPYEDISWSRHNWSLQRADEAERVPMILKVDEKSGETVFSNKGSHFLTPVYFRKELLGKYIEDSRSTVGTSSKELGEISHLDEWSITYGLNDLDRIVVWLGDLEKLPLNEQYYWRHFNIRPEGGIAGEFFKTQIEGEWIDSTSLEKRVIDLRNEINASFEERYGVPLFTSSDDDEENIKQLHTAIRTGLKALKPQFIALAKLFIDSIDKKALVRAIDDKELLTDADGKQLGTVSLLQVWHDKECGYEYPVTDTLQLIWKLRNLFSHKFSEEAYAKEIDTYDSRLDPHDPSPLYALLMTHLVRKLSRINTISANTP